MENIKLVVLDVDGTMTDGKIYIDNFGNESKSFNVKDGMAISQAIKQNIEVAIITGRSSKIVEIRASELGIFEVHQSVNDKVKKIKEISTRINISLSEICFIGDDINDLMAMQLVGYSACPRDAAQIVRSQVDYISQYNGGEGAVREIIEKILTEQGLWNIVLKQYEGGGQ